MSKELKALERLYDVSYDDRHSCMLLYTHGKELDTIKQALNELEMVKEFLGDIANDKELNQWLYDNRYEMWLYITNKTEEIK